MKTSWRTLTVVLCAGLFSGCALLPAEEEGRSIALVAEQEAPQYSVEKVTYRDVQHTETLYATYNRMGNQDYFFETSGILGQVYVSQGDSVEKGQLLAVLNTYEDAKLAVDQYTAEIEQLGIQQEELQSEMEFQKRHAEILYRYGELTAVQYEEQLNEIARNYDLPLQEISDTLYIDQMRLEEARAQMEQGAIYAAGDGMVTYIRNVAKVSNDMYNSYMNMYGWQEAEQKLQLVSNRANTVTAEEKIVSVADLETCAFVCETAYAERFQVGDVVNLSIGSDSTYLVKVSEIGDGVVYFQLSDKTQSVDVGTVGRYTLVLEEQPEALSISVTSLHETDDGYYVYYVDDAGLRQIKTVEVGVIGNVYAQITGGLSEGDLVIKR
jgi:multidrug efflux pump subunit AcrA (membrane-fusion protein)